MGRSGSGDEAAAAASCSISLKAGQDYLLMLNRQNSPFVLPRFGSPYLSSSEPNFPSYIDQIGDFYAGRY